MVDSGVLLLGGTTMEIKFKVHKGSARISCIAYSICILLIDVVLYCKYSLNFFDTSKPFLRVHRSFESHDGFNYFFDTYPIVALVFCLFAFAVFLLMLKRDFLLLRKGYIAVINPKGIILANGRFVRWCDIDAIGEMHMRRKPHWIFITMKPIPAENIFERFFKKMAYGTIMLSDFEIGVKEAFKIFVVYWHKYR